MEPKLGRRYAMPISEETWEALMEICAKYPSVQVLSKKQVMERRIENVLLLSSGDYFAGSEITVAKGRDAGNDKYTFDDKRKMTDD